MDLLALAKTIADRVEAEASRAKIPVAVCVIDVHGNIVLHHRMSGAPAFAIELAERKAYTSALVGMRTADILPLVQPGQALFPLMSQGKYCAMGGGAPLSSEGERLAGVGVTGGSVEQTSPSWRRGSEKPNLWPPLRRSLVEVEFGATASPPERNCVNIINERRSALC
jgi:uncharacterized protein GlcG (DUF336 family)